MKKMILSALLLCGVLGFVSCNNGPYDADLKADYSNVPNWLDPKYAQTVGEIKCQVDGNWISFWGGKYYKQNGMLSVNGAVESNGKINAIVMSVSNYKGAGTYKIADGGNDGLLIYSKVGAPVSDSVYTATAGIGSGTLTILTESENVLYGTFEYNLHKTDPSDTTKKRKITEGSFKVHL